MPYITCPVCGRRIATASGSEQPAICPACGASLLAADARDESDTRPVPLDQLPTRPNTSASPVASASAPAEDGQTRDLPPSALPRQPGASRSLASTVGLIILVVLLLVIVVGAALAANGLPPFAQNAVTPTGATTPGPTATPTAIPYKGSGLYSISYPTGWLAPQHNDPPSYYSITFTNPSGGASLTITAQQTSQPVDAAAFDTQYLRALAAAGTAPASPSPAQAVALAGQDWTAMSADVTLATAPGQQQQYAHAVAMTTNHGGYAYTIVRLVPWPDKATAQSAFDTAERASFQPTLATFTFLI